MTDRTDKITAALAAGTWPNFKAYEFRCKCGCGGLAMDVGFLDALQALRTQFAHPMPVASGYRCPAYNARVSSTGRDGPHTTGRAVDVAVSGAAAFRLVTLALQLNFTGLGLRQHGGWTQRFVHLDNLTATGGHPRPRLWTYQAGD